MSEWLCDRHSDVLAYIEAHGVLGIIWNHAEEHEQQIDANLCSSLKLKGMWWKLFDREWNVCLKTCSENAFKEDGNSYTFISFARFLFHVILEVKCSCSNLIAVLLFLIKTIHIGFVNLKTKSKIKMNMPCCYC